MLARTRQNPLKFPILQSYARDSTTLLPTEQHVEPPHYQHSSYMGTDSRPFFTMDDHTHFLATPPISSPPLIQQNPPSKLQYTSYDSQSAYTPQSLLDCLPFYSNSYPAQLARAVCRADSDPCASRRECWERRNARDYSLFVRGRG